MAKMSKANFLDIELLWKCFLLGIFTYSVVVAVVEISIYYVLAPVLLYFSVSYLSLTFPEETCVNRVFGSNPRTQLRNADDSEFRGDSADDIYFCIAYRAASFDSAENNLDAIRQCSRNGCKFVHVDVKLTADNVAVVSRDTTILLKEDSVSLEKSIEESYVSEIGKNSILDETGESFQSEIPTLDEVISLCKSLNMKIMINLIHSTYYSSFDAMIDVVLRLYERNPHLFGSCVVSSANPYLLYKMRKRNSDIIVALHWTCFSQTPTTSISWLNNSFYNNKMQYCILELVDSCALWLLNNFIYRMVGLSALVLPKHLITPGVVEYWEKKNIRCMGSVVNLSAEKAYYREALGIAYLTDTVDVN